jgi:hypothetical protein
MAVQWLDASGTVLATTLKATPYGPWTVGSDSYFTNHASKIPAASAGVTTAAVSLRVGPWTGTALACAATGTVGTSAVVVVGPVGGTGPVEGEGEAENGCGFSVNPVKWMKCLFVPSDGAMQGWGDRIDSFKERPPFSIIVGGVSWISAIYGQMGCGVDGGPGTGCYGDEDAGTFVTPYGGAGMNVIGAGSIFIQSTSGGQLAYSVVIVSLWLTCGWLIFGRVSASFGGKGGSEG